VSESYSFVPKDVNPVGTWSFTAPTAPQGYESGDIVIAKVEAGYSATLKFGDYTVKGSSVKYEKDVMTFTVYLEGEYISMKGTFEEKTMKGTASYSEGVIDFTAKKKETKK
jgi:hypothetical protein